MSENIIAADGQLALTQEERNALQKMLDAHDRGWFHRICNAMTDRTDALVQQAQTAHFSSLGKMTRGRRSAFATIVAAATCVCGNAAADERCAITGAQAVEAAIAHHVQLGLSRQEEIDRGGCMLGSWKPGTPCVNSTPYFTIEQFKAENPDCCKVANPVPGDFSPNLRLHVEGKKPPRLFLIEMKYRIYYLGKTDERLSQMKQDYGIVNCSGHVLPGLSFSLN